MTTLEWFGTATFRVRSAAVTLFFDAYLDRVPGLDPVGLSTAEVASADFVFVSHAHFDHLFGADAIARRTGATVVASPEACRFLRTAGVPEEQLLMVTGGETVACGSDVRVRVLPALHACLYARSEADTGAECLGDLGVSAQDRASRVAALWGLLERLPGPVGAAVEEMLERSSKHDGGQLSFHLITPRGSVLVSGSAGYWRGIFADLRPDLALLSVGGRPNLDGEPYQGSTARFILEQVETLRPGAVAFCHHDPLVPGVPGVDIGPAAHTLHDRAGHARYLQLEYATPVPLFT